MQFLSAMAQLPLLAFYALGAVGVVLLFWLWGRLARRHYLMIARSEATEQIEIQLERIANAVERLAARPDWRPPASSQMETPAKGISLSMLGR